MNEDFKKHFNNLSRNFFQKFKESLKSTENYAIEMDFDEDTLKMILLRVYEQQILSILLTIFSNYGIDDFVDSVHRIMEMFETNCGDAKQFSELFSLVSTLLNKQEQ